MAPGDGGTCFYLKIHPQDPNWVIESKDMGGTYVTTNGSRSYQSVNDPDRLFPRLHFLNAIDFCRAQPDVGYAVSDRNGVFKTTDKGLSWVPLDTAPLDALYGSERAPLSTVAVHPDRPDQAWVGLGFLRNCEMSASRRLPNGMARTTDGGKTWTHVAGAFPREALLRKLIIAPKTWGQGSVMLAGTDRGLYVSRDGGHTWAETNGVAGKGLPHRGMVGLDATFDASTGMVAVAAALRTQPRRDGNAITFSGGVWRSKDLGETWEDATGNLRFPAKLMLATPEARGDMHTNPVKWVAESLLWDDYLASLEDRSAYEAAVLDPKRGNAFVDYCAAYSTLKAGKSAAMKKEVALRLENSSCILPDFHTVRIDPRNPRVMYVSIHRCWLPFGVWKTVDGGRSWVATVRAAQGWADPAWSAYRPAGGPACNVEQVWTSKHPMNWGTNRCVFGLWDVRIFDLCEANPDVLYFHTHRVTYRSDNGGATWHDASNHVVPGSDGGFLGNGNSNMCVFDLAFHPKTPGRMLFAMADCGVKTSRDGGCSLKAMPMASFGSNQWVFGAAFDPDDADRFWQVFGCWDWLVGGISGAYLLESRDFGKTCEGVAVAENGDVRPPPKLAALDAHVNRFLVDPRSPKELRRFVVAHSIADRFAISYRQAVLKGSLSSLNSGDSKGILISEDAGKTWTAGNAGLNPDNLNIVDLVADPRNFDVLYAAVFLRVEDGNPISGGLFRSTDSGRSWSKLDALPLSNVSQVVALAGGVLYAAGGYGTTNKVWDNDGGVYRSADGGKTWLQLLAAPCVSCVAVSPADPELKLIYCTVDSGSSRRPDVLGSGVWRSTDGGAMWRRVNLGLATNFAFTFLRFNPHEPREIWAGTFNTGWYRAKDPGEK